MANLKPKHVAPALSVAILLLVLGFASSDGDSPKTNADEVRPLVAEKGIVTFSKGDVQIRRMGSDWVPLYVGDFVRPEDSLRSGVNGRTEVSWGNPRRVVRMERESVLALGAKALGNRLVLAGIRVDQGVVWAKVAGRPLNISAGDLETSSPNATLAIRRQSSGDRLSVYQGRVQAFGRSIGAGEGIVSRNGELSMFTVSSEDDLRDGWRDIVKEATVSAAHEAYVPQAERLTRDLHDLNPEIYLGVEVEMTGMRTKGVQFQADKTRIRKIRVKSSRWDGMTADRKVRLLNDTFDVLKERYPGILETVVLEFDDDRPRLSLKYAGTG